MHAMSSSKAAQNHEVPFKMALCQLSVSEDKQENIRMMEKAVSEAAANGAKMIVLPEMWNCPYSNESFPIYAEDIDAGDSPSAAAMSNLASSLSVYVIGGSIPENNDEGKLFNTCCVYGPDGALLGKHRKAHLFDIDIPGSITFKESDTLTKGGALTVVDTEYGKVGIGICYDIRFPEMATVYANRGAQMIVYPGAFNITTGPLHWQLLTQARAVDNLLHVATCSPARDTSDGAKYTAWGHSSVVGPFAEVMAEAGHGQEIVYADIDFKKNDTRRKNLPLQSQKRNDLYELKDCRNAIGFKF